MASITNEGGGDSGQYPQFAIPLSKAMQELVERLEMRDQEQKMSKTGESMARPEGVSSAELVSHIASYHPDIAHGRLEKALSEMQTGSGFGLLDPVNTWIENIIGLYDPGQVHELNGRLAILGICELDEEVGHYLERHNIPELIKKEISTDYDYDAIRRPGTTDDLFSSDDPYVLHLDTAAEQDHLGRDGFVEALAIWLNRIWHKSNPDEQRGEENSFMVHLHGSWGAGKTTLLNILQKKLQEPQPYLRKPWIVISFNAWKHNYFQPVWWPLLSQVYRDAHAQVREESRWKAFRIWFFDLWWKLRSGNKNVGLAFLVLLVVSLALFLWTGDRTGESVAKIVTSAGTILTGSIYLVRSLFWGSAESADHYIRLVQDPLEKIKMYFTKLVELIDRPVIVFIDDLDRCESTFVVNLLEQIQTLFNDSRVFYLLAADRRWIYGSFEEQYNEFRKHIDEPGKRLGYLFLDKIFQLSISVPQISRQTQEAYLDYLYRGENRFSNEEMESMRQEARTEFSETSSEAALIDKAGRSTGDGLKDQIRREEAVRASASKEMEASTEFFLKDFAHLLEPNPRSIKRLVNNYGIYRAIVILSDLELINSLEKRKKFVIWNILNMRWPLLVEYLEENPTELAGVLNGEEDQIGSEVIRELVKEPGVVKLFHDNEMEVHLDTDYVERILRLDMEPMQ